MFNSRMGRKKKKKINWSKEKGLKFIYTFIYINAKKFYFPWGKFGSWNLDLLVITTLTLTPSHCSSNRNITYFLCIFVYFSCCSIYIFFFLSILISLSFCNNPFYSHVSMGYKLSGNSSFILSIAIVIRTIPLTRNSDDLT